MSSGRGWTFVSLLSGLVTVLVFVSVFLAYGGRVAVAPVATPMPTPGQPVDTPFIYAEPPPVRAAPAPSATAAPPSSQTGEGSSASENNAAPDVSVPPNPFTAGVHT